MTKYLVLYSSPMSAADMMATSSPEERQAGMDAWMAWAQRTGDALADFGMPLGSSVHIEDGSSAPGSPQVSGYSIVQADSLDAAAKILEDHPHLHTPGGAIDVHEFLPMPGM